MKAKLRQELMADLHGVRVCEDAGVVWREPPVRDRGDAQTAERPRSPAKVATYAVAGFAFAGALPYARSSYFLPVIRSGSPGAQITGAC